LQAPA